MTTPAAIPLVSIVTPAYNSGHVIERTITSVMHQDYPRVEHIVVDGGSTDGTVDILRRYPHLRWISEPDRGQSNAINKGFRMAQGNILAWLNADDTYNAGAISTAVHWLQSNPNVGLVHSDYHVIDEEDRRLYTLHAIDFELDQLFLTNEVPGQFTAFWHRYVWDRVGYLDEDLHYVMDYDYWLRIAMIFPVKRIPGSCPANFRYYPGTKTHSHPEAFRAEAARVVTHALESAAFAALPPLVKRRARASGLRHQAIIACYSDDPMTAAALFRSAADSFAELRARDTEVIVGGLGVTARSPFVVDAVAAMQELFNQPLPANITRLRRKALGFTHHTYALDCFADGKMRQARRHMLLSFGYMPDLMRNRGMWSILAQTVLGRGTPSRVHQRLAGLLTQ